MVDKFERGEGTGGVEGQLYETKLVSLLLFRLLHDNRIEKFALASNYKNIGKFDDICLRVQVVGRRRPILILIQAKHKEQREEEDKEQKEKEDKELEYAPLIRHLMESIVKVKENFFSNEAHTETFFSGNFHDTDCMFILYTNAIHVKSYTKNTSDNNEYDQVIHDLIGTGGKVAQVDYADMILEHEATMLAEHFALFLTNKEQTKKIMSDTYIVRYHVYLAQHVVHISEHLTDGSTSEAQRTWKFRSNFLYTDDNDKIISMFRDKLLEIIFTHQLQHAGSNPITASNKDKSTEEEQTSNFVSEPSLSTLRPLIKTYSLKKNDKKDKFFVIAQRPKYDVKKLKAAEITVAKSFLCNLQLKVPVAFGNVDLLINKNERLNHLATKITDLCNRTSKLIEPYRIVTLDKGIDPGFLRANGGIGSAVGNLLVYDKETNYLMFTKDETSLKDKAITLIYMLKNRLDDLDKYRFDVKDIIDFPLLSFDFSEEAKLIHIYYQQSNQRRLEEILKKEIDQKHYIKYSNISVKPETIFLHFHNEIQEWSLLKKAPYFEETSDIYERTVMNIEMEPQMTALRHAFYKNNKTYFEYDFTDEAKESFKCIEELSRCVVVTDIALLTTVKVIRCLKHKYNNNNYSVLDFNYTLSMKNEEFFKLISELDNTKKEHIIIVLYNIINSSENFDVRLNQLTKGTKKTIVITDKPFLERVRQCFVQIDEVIYDEMQSICDLVPECQQNIIDKTEVLFQGNKVFLKSLVDNDTIHLIKGVVFKKILYRESIEIGTSLDNKNDENDISKSIYIDRKLSRSGTERTIVLKTFQDINDDVVLITAEPGMGKSTLLDYLALNGTDANIWIVKIRFVELSSTFENWSEKKKVINILDVLQCIWQVVSKHKHSKVKIKQNEHELFATDNSGDEEVLFEINLFLHFHKNGKLMFLLDGFDEICPEYKKEATDFITALKTDRHKIKIWVTSRPYKDLLQELQLILGETYTLELFNHEEQKVYLKRNWQAKINLESVSTAQINNLIRMIESTDINEDYRTVCYYFCDFLQKQPFGTKCNEGKYLDTLLIRQSSVTPLILYLIADYFVTLIDDFDTLKFDKAFNQITIYRSFVNSKIKRHYIEKCEVDLSNPRNKRVYRNNLPNNINMYKKIGAYTVFKKFLADDRFIINEYKDMPLKMEHLIDCEAVIEDIGTKDLAGLISQVTHNNIPVFVHMTFAEYLAAEYVCDILTNDTNFDRVECLYMVIYIHHNNSLLKWVQEKRKVDADLDRIISKIEKSGAYEQVKRIVHCNIQ